MQRCAKLLGSTGGLQNVSDCFTSYVIQVRCDMTHHAGWSWISACRSDVIQYQAMSRQKQLMLQMAQGSHPLSAAFW